MKMLYIFLGSISLFLGVLGAFLPLLPTVPFVLLTVTLFSKSSPRLYNWIINHKIFGKYIRSYREEKSIPMFAKISSVLMLWLSISFSIFYVLQEKWFLQLLLFCIAAVVTVYIFTTKTRKVIK